MGAAGERICCWDCEESWSTLSESAHRSDDSFMPALLLIVVVVVFVLTEAVNVIVT